MKLVDIHTHKLKFSPEFREVRNLYIGEAEDILTSDGTGYFSVGVHPWYPDKLSENWYQKLERFCNDKRVLLIGECGLDKNSAIPVDLQTKIFEQHIQLSEAISKPLIIHCVGCFNELLNLRKNYKPAQRWIIHGYRGKPQLAEQILDYGCDISFGEKFNPESVKRVPLENLFVETDESTFSIDEIYRRLASAKNCNAEDLSAGSVLLRCLGITDN
ncbi:MAG: TatD family hydrolase [Paludibacteraceae bacterium]